MLRYYPAIVCKEPDSDFGVSFPDFPGCVSAGATHSEALILAREALSLHIEGMLADGESLPEPTSIEKLHAKHTQFSEETGSFVTLIEAALPGPSKRINITLEESLLDEIDSAVGILGTNRSAFLGEAAREKLDEVFFRRLNAAFEETGSALSALDRIVKEDEKRRIRERHPPDISQVGVSDYERDRQ